MAMLVPKRVKSKNVWIFVEGFASHVPSDRKFKSIAFQDAIHEHFHHIPRAIDKVWRFFGPKICETFAKICGEVDDASNKMPQKMWIQLLCGKKSDQHILCDSKIFVAWDGFFIFDAIQALLVFRGETVRRTVLSHLHRCKPRTVPSIASVFPCGSHQPKWRRPAFRKSNESLAQLLWFLFFHL